MIVRLKEDIARVDRRLAGLATTPPAGVRMDGRGAESQHPGSEVSQWRDEVERLSSEVVRLGSEVRELRESTSWRITAPMRALKDAGLRIGGMLLRAAGALGSARREQAASIRQSGIFDAEYYAAQTGAPQPGAGDPVEDYLARGA